MSRRNEVIAGLGHPVSCYFCGKEVVKLEGTTHDSLALHSLDGDHENWDPSNKVPAHNGCHMTYHNTVSAAEERFKGSRPPPRRSRSTPRPGVTTFIVDYDLPADFRRKRFYRRIRRYLVNRWMDPTEWSTQSVVVTPERDFAMFVFHAARDVGGKAHVYEAVNIDPM